MFVCVSFLVDTHPLWKTEITCYDYEYSLPDLFIIVRVYVCVFQYCNLLSALIILEMSCTCWWEYLLTIITFSISSWCNISSRYYSVILIHVSCRIDVNITCKIDWQLSFVLTLTFPAILLFIKLLTCYKCWFNEYPHMHRHPLAQHTQTHTHSEREVEHKVIILFRNRNCLIKLYNDKQFLF